jgi:hypothetical protein
MSKLPKELKVAIVGMTIRCSKENKAMDTTEENTDLVELSTTDRRILKAALKGLAEQVKDLGPRDPLVRHVDLLRTKVGWFLEPHAAPDHLMVNETEFLRLMSVLPTSESWRLYVERDDSLPNERYNFVAELTRDGTDWHFELAGNLIGTGRFLELRDADVSYVRAVEGMIAAEAGQSAQIIHQVIEIPVPWDFMPDDEAYVRVEAYVESASNGAVTPAIHATYVDVHSDDDLAVKGFGGIMSEVSGFPDEIADLKTFLERHLAEIKETASHAATYR